MLADIAIDEMNYSKRRDAALRHKLVEILSSASWRKDFFLVKLKLKHCDTILTQ